MSAPQPPFPYRSPLHLVSDDPPAAPPAAPQARPPHAPKSTVAPHPAQPLPAHAKIMSREQLLAARQAARQRGQALVQCHGCFDIVHPGHLRHLRHAKAQGDILLVTITGDALINKGTGRPLIPQELRAENLAALDCVDWVYIENRPTAVELLEDVKPDIYVKGREYEMNNDPRFQAERDTVSRHGGRVVFSSGDVVFSSTALIAALEQSVDPYHARLQALLKQPEISGERLTGTIAQFRGKRVVVVGETIADTYVMCDKPDVAGESPVMTLRPVERRSYDGGAAIIARHLAAMGAQPVLVTAMDDSDLSVAIRQRLIAEGVQVRAVHTSRPIPEKQRFLVGTQKVMKLDLVQRLELDAQAQDQFISQVHGALTDFGSGSAQGADACIIADFGLGLITQSALPRLAALARHHAGIVAGDVSGKRSHLLTMKNFDLLCPSESEVRESCRQFDQSLTAVAWELLEQTASRHAIVTMGPDGLIAFDRLPTSAAASTGWTSRLKAEHVPALSALAIDALGCGDALIAAATLALTTNSGLLPASFLGALAAAVQVQRLGNTVISATDLRHSVARVHAAHLAYAQPELQAPRPASAPLHAPPTGYAGQVVGGNAARLAPLRVSAVPAGAPGGAPL